MKYDEISGFGLFGGLSYSIGTICLECGLSCLRRGRQNIKSVPRRLQTIGQGERGSRSHTLLPAYCPSETLKRNSALSCSFTIFHPHKTASCRSRSIGMSMPISMQGVLILQAIKNSKVPVGWMTRDFETVLTQQMARMSSLSYSC